MSDVRHTSLMLCCVMRAEDTAARIDHDQRRRTSTTMQAPPELDCEMLTQLQLSLSLARAAVATVPGTVWTLGSLQRERHHCIGCEVANERPRDRCTVETLSRTSVQTGAEVGGSAISFPAASHGRDIRRVLPPSTVHRLSRGFVWLVESWPPAWASRSLAVDARCSHPRYIAILVKDSRPRWQHCLLLTMPSQGEKRKIMVPCSAGFRRCNCPSRFSLPRPLFFSHQSPRRCQAPFRASLV